MKMEENSSLESLQKIIKDTLRVLPFGNIMTHTPENIPDRVQDLAKEAAEECRLREKWEELADRLIVYAEIVQVRTKEQDLYELICEDIRQYNNMKKALD